MILVLTYAKKYTSSGSKKILYLSKHINVLKMYNNKINIFLTYLDALQERSRKQVENQTRKKRVWPKSVFSIRFQEFLTGKKRLKMKYCQLYFSFKI